MSLWNTSTHISSLFSCPGKPNLLFYSRRIRTIYGHIPAFWAHELQSNPVVEFDRHPAPFPLWSCSKKSVLMKQYQLRVDNPLDDETNVYLPQVTNTKIPSFYLSPRAGFTARDQMEEFEYLGITDIEGSEVQS